MIIVGVIPENKMAALTTPLPKDTHIHKQCVKDTQRKKCYQIKASNNNKNLESIENTS